MNSSPPIHKTMAYRMQMPIVIVLTLLAAILVYEIDNIPSIKNERLTRFPNQIGNWNGQSIHMEEWVFDSLETNYAILKNYFSSDGQQINLAIVWYDDKEIAFHSAAACLGGIGAFVKEDDKHTVTVSGKGEKEISKIIAEQQLLKRVVLYYYISDGYITGSQKKLRAHILKKRIKFKRSSAAFVRIMAVIQKSEMETTNLLEKFLVETLPIVDAYTKTEIENKD